MNSKHRKTLAAVFASPVSGTVKWRDSESLLEALGAEIEEGSGSRVSVLLNQVPATFHRPHPSPETDKGAVKSVRRLLISAGVTKDG